MAETKWVPVWTDEKMLKIVINSNLTTLSKLREDFNRGELTVKIPFLEYRTGTIPETETLPFTKENDLAKVLKVLTRNEILEKIGQEKDFTPFVVNLEAIFHMMTDLARWIREEVDYMLSISRMRESFKTELEKIKDLSDLELYNEFQKGMYNPAPANRSKISMRQYRDILKTDYPAIDMMIADAVVSKKPTVVSRFNGKDYLTYFVGEQMEEFGGFCVYFPLESASDLPNLSSLKARIIGIMFFNANPPKKGLSPLTLVGVSMFLPWNR
jgi:hypothetical protein